MFNILGFFIKEINMNILKNIFGKKMNENDYVSELQSKIKDLEKERQELKFQLEENELEYKDTLIEYQSKIEKLSEENLKLKHQNSNFSMKLSEIVLICSSYVDEKDQSEEIENEDY